MDPVYSWQLLQVSVCFLPFMEQTGRKGNGLEETGYRKHLRVQWTAMDLEETTSGGRRASLSNFSH